MTEYKTTNTALTAMANKIREKNNINDSLVWNNETGFANDIENIVLKKKTSDANATDNDILNTKTAYVNGTKITGNISIKTSSDITMTENTLTIPTGYYSSINSYTISTTTHANPTISINTSTGLITASHAQPSGYIIGGTTNETLQLITQGAQTITPGTSDKTAITAGKYTTGAITVAGSANLVAANIKNGINIFGVTGTYEGDLTNNAVVFNTNFSTIATSKFSSHSFLTTLNCPNVTTISSTAFYNCVQLSSAYFPNCTTISSYAFSSCSNLKIILFS